MVWCGIVFYKMNIKNIQLDCLAIKEQEETRGIPKCKIKVEFDVLINLFPARSVQKPLSITNINRPYNSLFDTPRTREYSISGRRTLRVEGITWPAP